MEIEEIEKYINKRNLKHINSKCKVLNVFENTKTKINTILIETTAKVYNQIVKNKSRVHIGYQNCRAFHDLNLTPCFGCGRIGHSGTKCGNPKICLNCAPGEHNCTNFIYSNHQFITKYETKHVVNDTEKYEVMIHKAAHSKICR